MQQDKIQMVDLYSQYVKIKSRVDAAIQKVIDESAFVKGNIVKEFEQALSEYLDVAHVISCANGTDALQIAMMALGLKPSDEIIVPTFTYVATAEAIALLGLTPIMVDVDKDDFCLDVQQLESVLTANTKAIVPVHLYGQVANMDELLAFAKKNNLYVIEDTAQALGAKYTMNDGTIKRAGCIGDIGTTSFFPSKNLGCFGDGGALMTNDSELALKIRMIANHGQKELYKHEVVGINSRLDGIQAAILLEKLKELDNYELSRNDVASFYDRNISNPLVIKPFRKNKSTHVFHQYTIKVQNGKRDDLRQYLLEMGIPTMIYYPISLHKQEAYKHYYTLHDDFVVANKLVNQVLSLPMHTEMNVDNLYFIANAINEFK